MVSTFIKLTIDEKSETLKDNCFKEKPRIIQLNE